MNRGGGGCGVWGGDIKNESYDTHQHMQKEVNRENDHI